MEEKLDLGNGVLGGRRKMRFPLALFLSLTLAKGR
jgi:hypothetical protein